LIRQSDGSYPRSHKLYSERNDFPKKETKQLTEELKKQNQILAENTQSRGCFSLW
jgi:hypothetical protein